MLQYNKQREELRVNDIFQTYNHIFRILPTIGIWKGPMTVAIAMQGEEEVSPIIACTWAGLLHGASDGVETTSLPLAKASATLTPLAMEPQESYIL